MMDDFTHDKPLSADPRAEISYLKRLATIAADNGDEFRAKAYEKLAEIKQREAQEAKCKTPQT